MKKRELVKKLQAFLFGTAIIFSSGMHETERAGAKTAQDTKRTYIIHTEDESTRKKLSSQYEKVNTISDLSSDRMQEENFTTLELTETEAQKLEKKDAVELVEPDVVVKGSSICCTDKKVEKIRSRKADKNREWNLQAIHTKKQKKKGNGKNKVKVAILDSGVDLFNDIEVKESINLIPGEEEVLPLFWDTSGHGTSIAGVLAAQDNKEGITGIDPNIELYSARVLDAEKSAPVSRIIEAVYWAIEKNVDIISISFGTTQYSEALELAIKEAYNKGILIVAAAGNQGKVEYPAAMEEVIAVGGTDTSGEVCDYSAKGEEIELVAPAEQICATGSFDGTVICNGTSMAVPHVVGVAAKLWEKDRMVSADFIRQLMNASANQYGDTSEYGNGLVDYEQAVKVYDEFAENYEPANTVEENKEAVGENLSPVEQFTDVDYVNGSWELADHKTCVSVGISGKGIAAATISAMKRGAIYPDKSESTVTGMGAYPYMHGYFKYDTKKANNNYILSYIDLTKEAEKIRRGKEDYIGSIVLPYIPTADTFYKRIGWSNQSCTNNAQKGAFAWGVAIHSATDVYSHCIYGYWKDPNKESGYKWQRFFHDKKKHGNNYADDSNALDLRFTVAKEVTKNIIAHYVKGEQGQSGDFYCSLYNEKKFKLYNFWEYMNQAGNRGMANQIKKYSITY